MSEADRRWHTRGLHEAALAGNERAWRELYDESYATLDRYIGWRCGGLRDLADEVLQETWLTAVRRLRDFDPERSDFGTWLRGIAVNVLRNLLRRRRPEPLPAEIPQRKDLERGRRVAEALAQLPEHYERVLRMKYLEGRSVEEIAAVSRETPKAIESQLTRARAAFRGAYGPHE